jgi:5-methylcytosine-specific restriction endonuclease McrA
MGQTQTKELYKLSSKLEEELRKVKGFSKKHRKLCYQIILAMRSSAPNVKNVKGQRQHLGDYKVDDVLPYLTILGGKKDREYKSGCHTFKVKMNSVRYRMFLGNLSCVRCGVIGSIFKMERMSDGSSDRAHFNLYAKHPITGTHILMTKDHIYPKSKGGRDHLDNYQTMCSACNNDKGNTLERSRDIHLSKFTDWVSPNKKWIITIDAVTGYDIRNSNANKYLGRVIDLTTGNEFGWSKSVAGHCLFNKKKLPLYIKKQIRSVEV